MEPLLRPRTQSRLVAGRGGGRTGKWWGAGRQASNQKRKAKRQGAPLIGHPHFYLVQCAVAWCGANAAAQPEPWLDSRRFRDTAARLRPHELLCPESIVAGVDRKTIGVRSRTSFAKKVSLTRFD